MKTLTIDIRKAEPADAEAIADVHRQAWEGAYSGIIPHRALGAMLGRRGRDWWANAVRRAASILVLDVDGIVVPATRRGYTWQGDYQVVPEPLLVAIDMGEITVRRAGSPE